MDVRRVGALLTVVMALLAGLPAVAAATPAEETELVALINQSRAGAGLAPLTVYDDLVDDARRHTKEMIARGQIFHSTSSQLAAATTGWSLLGENVGMGPNPSVLHTAFMGSPSHRANVLGAFHRVGVGAERAPDGALFVTVIFMQAATAPATTTTPPTTTTTTPSTTTTTTPSTTTTTTPSTTTTTTPSTTTAIPAGSQASSGAAAPSVQEVAAAVAPSPATPSSPSLRRLGHFDSNWGDEDGSAGSSRGLWVRLKADGVLRIE